MMDLMSLVIPRMNLGTYNGNKIESSPIRSVIIRVINKIERPRSGSLICQLGVWLQTELDGTKYCYQLIVTVIIYENNKYIKDKYVQWKQRRSKKFLNLEKFRISGCCNGYCDQFCDWWIWLKGPSMIGCFNCPITGVRLQPTVKLHCPITTLQTD